MYGPKRTHERTWYFRDTGTMYHYTTLTFPTWFAYLNDCSQTHIYSIFSRGFTVWTKKTEIRAVWTYS